MFLGYVNPLTVCTVMVMVIVMLMLMMMMTFNLAIMMRCKAYDSTRLEVKACHNTITCDDDDEEDDDDEDADDADLSIEGGCLSVCLG